MAQTLFTIADEELMLFLKRTGEAFSKADVPHMFVGGIAHQLYVARYLCNAYNQDFLSIAESDKIDIPKNFRPTDNVDIALKIDGDDGSEEARVAAGRRLSKILETVVTTDPLFSLSENALVSIRAKKIGYGKSVFILDNDTTDNEDYREITLNIFCGPNRVRKLVLGKVDEQLFDIFLERAANISIPYIRDKKVEVKVTDQHDHLATKILRGKPWDISDSLTFYRYARAANAPIEHQKVLKVLYPNGVTEGEKESDLYLKYSALVEMDKILERDETS